jgi:GMP synthase (glutamine-hydrolysing)
MSRNTKLLVLKAGDTLDTVKSAFGDFDAMFIHHLDEHGVEPHVVQAHRGEPLPRPEEFDATIITGSPHSVTAREPWADALSTWTREAVEREHFVLGVCYGHQLLAHALGGRVEKNPNGYEVGTISVSLTAEAASDPLLGPIARGSRLLEFHSTHSDAVTEAPRGVCLLASTPSTQVQAFRAGERAWGVQFHPEFTDGVMRLYIEGRTNLIEKDAARRGVDAKTEIERIRAGVKPTTQGRLLLRRFIDIARGRDLGRLV